MTLSDFLNGLHICFSLFTLFTLSSVHVAQKNVTCCTKSINVIQKFKLGLINLINFCRNGSPYFSSPETHNDY